MCFCIPGFCPESLADEPCPCFKLTCLAGDHSQEMVGLWIIWFLGKDLPVELFGLLQLAGLEMLHGLLQQLGSIIGCTSHHEKTITLFRTI